MFRKENKIWGKGKIKQKFHLNLKKIRGKEKNIAVFSLLLNISTSFQTKAHIRLILVKNRNHTRLSLLKLYFKIVLIMKEEK